MVAQRVREAANPILAAKIRSIWGTIGDSLSLLLPSMIFSGDRDGERGCVLVVVVVAIAVVIDRALSFNTKHCRGGKLPMPLLVFPNVRFTTVTTVPPIVEPPQIKTSSKRDRNWTLFSVADCDGLSK